MPQIPPPLHTTVRRIYRLHEARREAETPRGYLGMSELGEACSRRLWYGWRMCGGEVFDGRMLRLFGTGHREEARLIEELRAIGCKVEGEQFAVDGCDGHLRGHLDGAVLGLEEAPKTWHTLEVKTHNAKSFAEVKAKGVQATKPRHYAQITLYMGHAGMERGAYFAICKDTDEIVLERVHFDRAEFARLMAKAQAIIGAPEPPRRLSENPAWYECRYCPHHAQCHQTAPTCPPANCRTCAHSTPVADGAWHCASFDAAIPFETQREGCDEHRYIPALVPWLELIEADGNAIAWQNTLNGATARQPQYLSREFHAARDKKFVGDEFVAAMKSMFGDGTRIVNDPPPESGDSPRSDLGNFYDTHRTASDEGRATPAPANAGRGNRRVRELPTA